MEKNSIALIGFMATGKTTIGKALARYLGNDYVFLETDELVIKLSGKSIPEIFSEDGEQVFRQLERMVCRNISSLEKVVISCGGGVVLNPLNISDLKKNCFIILLTAPLHEIYNRIMQNGKEKRPIISNNDSFKEIKNILNSRQILYDSAAEFSIDTSKKSINTIIKEILEFCGML
jgi:shikimate kinase